MFNFKLLITIGIALPLLIIKIHQKCVEAGPKNKMSYEIKAGHAAANQVVKACEETRYDLVVMTTSHLDSWLRSLFSEARKIISKINTPVPCTPSHSLSYLLTL